MTPRGPVPRDRIGLVVNTSVPVSWTLEFIDEDGGIEMTSFTGPDSEKRARDYAAWKYGAVSVQAESA